MRAELKMAEKKIEMEKAEKAARSKLPELKITTEHIYITNTRQVIIR